MLGVLRLHRAPGPTSLHFDGPCKRGKCHSRDIVRDQDHAPILTVDSDSFSLAFIASQYSGASARGALEC